MVSEGHGARRSLSAPSNLLNQLMELVKAVGCTRQPRN